MPREGKQFIEEVRTTARFLMSWGCGLGLLHMQKWIAE
jgi:hypothetical protein